MARKRNEIEEVFKWDLTPIFKCSEDWKREYSNISSEINDITKYRSTFLNSSNDLLNFLKQNEDFERRLYKLYYYANLSYDSDTLNVEYQEMHEQIENLINKYSSLVSFFEPTLLSKDYDFILGFCSENKELSKYKFEFEKLFRYKTHVLTEELEAALAKLSKPLTTSSDIYSILTDSDMSFGDIKDKNGNILELTESNYAIYRISPDRVLRKNAFDMLHSTYSNYKNTISATFRGNVDYLRELANLKNFNSSIEAALYDDNVDLDIYNNLVSTVNSHLDSLYKYYSMKKRALKLDELHLYDIYVPIIKESNKTYEFSEARKLVTNALSVLGEDYIEIINKAFDERWIDIYNNEGKRGGAYSSGFYDTNPYVLLNYEGTLNDVSTLAHELGHSMHTYLSCKNNDYIYSSYKIFVAEVASTVNELLLSKYLLKTSKDKNEKLSILNNLLELFKGTIYRQTMFAEFEQEMHDMSANGVVLTSNFISSKYYDVVKKYFGDGVVCDELIKYEWERIPHFYYNFYVYKYATGLSAACYIVNNIFKNGETAIADYKKFLSSGGSKYPVEELKLAGVDINSKEVIESAISMFDETLNEFETLYFD